MGLLPADGTRAGGGDKVRITPVGSAEQVASASDSKDQGSAASQASPDSVAPPEAGQATAGSSAADSSEDVGGQAAAAAEEAAPEVAVSHTGEYWSDSRSTVINILDEADGQIRVQLIQYAGMNEMRYHDGQGTIVDGSAQVTLPGLIGYGNEAYTSSFVFDPDGTGITVTAPESSGTGESFHVTRLHDSNFVECRSSWE